LLSSLFGFHTAVRISRPSNFGPSFLFERVLDQDHGVAIKKGRAPEELA
jgi:hypothetical protein